MSTTKRRILIVIRHAHRDIGSDRLEDNGLSEKGKEQAKAFCKMFRTIRHDKKAELFSSPKKRCRQTLKPLAKKMDSPIKVMKLLDEGGDLLDKAKRFRRWLNRKKASIVIVCSHGDLMPILYKDLTGQTLDFKKGEWRMIER